jgi:VWFA-related protein
MTASDLRPPTPGSRRPRRVRPSFARALAAGLLASPLAAQAPDPAAERDRRFGETVDVRVVNVDVVVTDRDGRPVQGLEPEDFEVFEDGRPQEITNFYRVEGPRVQADGQEGWEVIAPDSSFRRRVLLLLDNNFITTPERDRALDVLQTYLDQKFDGSYEWSVVAVGDDIRVLLPFSDDKLLVRAALDRVASLPTFASRYRIDRHFLNDPVRVRRSQRAAAAADVTGSGSDATETFQQALRFESKIAVAATLQAFERTTTAMVQAFRAYGDLPGNKVLVWITGGVPMLPEYGFQGEGTAGQDQVSSKDTELRQYQTELRELVDAAAYEANAAQFKVYPVKATGVEPPTPQNDPGFRSSGATFSEAALSSSIEVDDNDTAQLSLALGTGGLYLTSNRTLDSFETADQDTTNYYSLGYRPARAEDDGLHDLRVEVKKPGLVARSRRAFVDLSPEKRLEAVLATPLPFPREKGSLPVSVEVARPGGDEVLATVQVANESLTFLPEGDFYVGRVKIYLTIHDEVGNLVDLVSEEKDLRFPTAQRDDVLAGRFRYGLKFRLKDRGAYVISVTLRDRATDEIGTAFSNVRI